MSGSNKRDSQYAAQVAAVIDEAFAPLVAMLSARLEHVGDSWSPAQHARRVR